MEESRKLHALVRLGILQLWRAARDARTGKSGSRPLLTLVFLELVLGCAFVVSASGPVPAVLSAAFSAAILQATFLFAPDALDARRRWVELVASKPLLESTVVLGRVSTIALTLIVVLTCYLLPLLSRLVWLGEMSLFQALLAFTLVLGTTLCMAIGWQVVSERIAQRFGFERLRSLSVGLVMLAALAAAFVMPSALERGVFERPEAAWLPSAILVQAVMGEGLSAHLSLGGVLLGMGAVVYLAFWRADPASRTALNELLVTPTERRPKLSRRSWLLRALFARARHPGLAFARLVVLSTEREPLYRVSTWPWQLALFAGVALGLAESSSAVSHAAILGAFVLGESCRVVQFSASSGATVWFRTAPLSVEQTLLGSWVAVLAAGYWTSILASVLAIFLSHREFDLSMEQAVVLWLVAQLAESRVLANIFFGMTRTLPLGREAQTRTQLPSYLMGLWFALMASLRLGLARGSAVGFLVYTLLMLVLGPLSTRWAASAIEPK